MIDGKLTDHKDKDFVTMKTYKEVKAVSEQNARFISKSGTLFRAKAKLYCTAATSCEETKRSVLDAFTIYATGSLDLIFLICSSLIGSRHQCTLKSLLSGRHVLILILNSSIEIDQSVQFLQSLLWRSSTLVSKRSEIFLSTFLSVILLNKFCHVELSIVLIFDRSMDPLEPTRRFTTQKPRIRRPKWHEDADPQQIPTTTDKCVHSPDFSKIVPYNNKAKLAFSALIAKKDKIFFKKVIGVVQVISSKPSDLRKFFKPFVSRGKAVSKKKNPERH